MAFVTTETNVIALAGGPRPLVLVSGTYTNTAAGTGGIIMPGYTNSSGTFTAITYATGAQSASGARRVISSWLQTTTEDATTPKTATAYESTSYDRDQVTITTVANGTGNYYILAEDAGA